ncbi:hypothetical protein ACHHYP_12915 [Achlya hypogyna]|uniref:Uncharacterized protein n=1 Tax=Achlya hypogyna TaxID=1202772 RepID=A0A1V9ZGL3_ACHHY|nr:hypothetical protein ACHHYP_12915 [Achlya hypogyna]
MATKAEREAWIQAKLAERKKQNDKEAAIAAEALRATKDRLWSPYQHACLLTNELNLAWKGDPDFFAWPRVFPFHELTALRITGYALTELPLELATSLPLLECLSLIANALETLPENLGLLRHLTDIDVTKNRLRRLPDSICNLDKLTSLNLSNNRLEVLPDNFGHLGRLGKVWAEKNQLKETPATFGRLRSTVVSLSCNAFVHWDLSLPEFCNLTTLSINFNQLKGLPAALCSLPSLTSLSAANNAIAALPEAFGAMPKLRNLRLDWNQLRELPLSFRHLASLEELHLEHNPMVAPPLDVVYEGARAVVAFVQQRYLAWLRQERRKIVEQLQAVLTFLDAHVLDNQWTDLRAYYDPRVSRTLQGTRIDFFAVVVAALLSEVFPVVAPAIAAVRHPVVPQTFFERSLDDIVDALANFDDNYSTAGIFDETARFQKCMCVDPVSQAPKRCTVLSLGYACERSTGVCLVRAKMVTAEEYKEMQGDSYLMARRERLSAAMKRKCRIGVRFFEKTAEIQGTQWMANRAREAREAKAQAKAAKSRLAARKKTAARLDVLSKKSIKHEATLRKSIAGWEKDLAAVADAVKRTAKRDQLHKLRERQKELETRIDKARRELGAGDPKLRKLQAKLAQLDADPTATVPADSDDEAPASDGDRSNDESDDGSDVGSDEGDDSEEGSSAAEPDESGSESELDEGQVASVFAALGEIPGLEPCVDWIEAATATVDSIMAARPPKDKPYVEDVIALFHEELRHTYVKEKTTRVKNKVTTEFYQMKYVLRRWMGHGHRVLFVAWRDYVRERRASRDRSTEKQAKDEALAVQNHAAEVALGRLEAAKWEQKMNFYTDEYYYQHTLTGEVSALPPPYWADVQPPPTSKSTSFLPPLV